MPFSPIPWSAPLPVNRGARDGASMINGLIGHPARVREMEFCGGAIGAQHGRWQCIFPVFKKYIAENPDEMKAHNHREAGWEKLR